MMRLRLTLLFYNILLLLLLPLLLAVLLVEKRRRGGMWAAFRERCGSCRPEVLRRLAEGAGHTIWLNASSVGEVNVALKLIAELVRRGPGRPLVLTVTTTTGRALAERHAPPELMVISAPLDVWPLPGELVQRIRPAAYVPLESELWPNLLQALQKRGIPVVLANARLSPRSERRYRLVRWLTAPVFGMLDRVLVQEAADVARWQGLGVAAARVQVTGSIKYDHGGGAGDAGRTAEFRRLLTALWGESLPPLLMAASTHDGEEEAIARVFGELRREFPALRMAAVPRHVERRAEVRAALESRGLTTALRSELSMAAAPAAGPPDVLIVDSTGELRDWQPLATVVVVGRSFLTTGGQNPAEATAAGIPVVTGPHMENFAPLMELLRRADGIVTVPSLDALGPALAELLRDPARAAAMAARGRAALELHRGAAARTADVIDAVISSSNV